MKIASADRESYVPANDENNKNGCEKSRDARSWSVRNGGTSPSNNGDSAKRGATMTMHKHLLHLVSQALMGCLRLAP
jgi:hypothetical protein